MSLAISDTENFIISLKEQIYIDTALVLYIVQVKKECSKQDSLVHINFVITTKIK